MVRPKGGPLWIRVGAITADTVVILDELLEDLLGGSLVHGGEEQMCATWLPNPAARADASNLLPEPLIYSREVPLQDVARDIGSRNRPISTETRRVIYRNLPERKTQLMESV